MHSDLLNTDSGNAVIIALDHGLGLGSLAGYRDPGQTVERVLETTPDGVLLSPRVARFCRSSLEASDVRTVVTADYVALSTVPNETGSVVQTQPFSLDRIRRLDPTAVKVMLVFGQEDRWSQESNVDYVTSIAERFEDIPVVVETVLWGTQIPERMKSNPAAIETACRVAWELGADMLKIPYPGDQDSLERITRTLPIPVFILGGPSGSQSDLLESVQAAIDGGARGVMIGRAVWQADDPDRMVTELQEIVHGERRQD